MKRIMLVIFLIVLISSIGMCAPAAAQEHDLEMQVSIGFDGYCRTDGWCPVYVVLSNEGGDIEGKLRITQPSTLQVEEYARRVVLPAHSRKAYFAYILLESSPSRLVVQLMAEDNLLTSRQAAVSWVNKDTRIYGVASGSPSALNFLVDAPAGLNVAVAHLDLEALPPDPLGWEELDLLVLNDVDTTVLGKERRRTLETWVAHGGHLIVGGGVGAARTAAGIADFLPVALGGVRSVDTLWALGERDGASTAAGPYAVAETRLRDGESLIEQDDLILLSRRAYGMGKIDFLAFNAELNPFTRWEPNAHLWNFIIGAGPARVRKFSIHRGRIYRVREIINAIPGLELPSTLYILAFMFVYTLLIGPLNYLVLRKLDRRDLAWATIPLLIVGFTIFAYLTGFRIRGAEAIVHRLAVVQVPEGTEVGRVHQMVGLFSPRRAYYDLWVNGEGVSEISSSDTNSLHVLSEAEGATITDLRVDVGGIQPFITTGYTDVSGVDADIQLVKDATGGLRLEGLVHNGDLPLEEAVLLLGNDEQRLGRLEAGEKISVSRSLLTSLSYGNHNIPERIMGTANYWGDPDLSRKHNFLEVLFAHTGTGVLNALKKGRVYLMGWVEQDIPLPVDVMERPFSTVETGFYIYSLPVKGLETGATITIPPSLIEREVMETEGRVDIWDAGFRMGSGAKLKMRFTIWPGVAVSQVDRLFLEIQSSDSEDYSPQIWLWDEGNDEWDEIESGWGRRMVPEAGAYVTSAGEVILRLNADDEYPVNVERLTLTIEGKR